MGGKIMEDYPCDDDNVYCPEVKNELDGSYDKDGKMYAVNFTTGIYEVFTCDKCEVKICCRWEDYNDLHRISN